MTDSVAHHAFQYRTEMPQIIRDGTSPEAAPHNTHEGKGIYISSSKLYTPFAAQSHQYHESTSTSASDSTSSSPVTTMSLADDDSSVTELSPGSSPESPMATQSILSKVDPNGQDASSSTTPNPSFFEQSRPSTPGKRPRNLKNLAVNTTGTSGATRSMSVAEPAVKQIVDPVAPLRATGMSFRRPPSPPRRKQSKVSLTIMTPATSMASREVAQSLVPPTPSLMRSSSLRRLQSSPSLPSVTSHNFSDQMTGDAAQHRPILERAQSDLLTRIDDEDIDFDVPQSREEKPEAYPDGPICVFEPYIDLYLEPTAEQASRYDVILNVASEVRNPFISTTTELPEQDEIRFDGGGGIQYAPRRSRESSRTGSSTAWRPASEPSTPTTPKATPKLNAFPSHNRVSTTQPEYIHIPWEHNTDIVSDLVRLVRLIDDRVKQGKRLLIHCQCGVSRSATLVVAYCMFVHPEYSVQQAYDIIKKRSKWIGPNMNLIMQLQEFSSRIAMNQSRRAFGSSGLRSLTPVEGPSSWQSRRSSGVTQSGQPGQNAPRTAPLLPAGHSSANGRDLTAVTPGPSSAPLGRSWPFREALVQVIPDRKDGRALSVPEATALVDASSLSADQAAGSGTKPRPQSLRFDCNRTPMIEEDVTPLISPRSEQFAMTALRPSAALSAEDHFGIMSPTTSTFQHTPLDRGALLGALGMGSSMQQDSGKRRTQNFSLPFRSSLMTTGVADSTTGPSQLETDDAPVERTLLAAPPRLESLVSPRTMSFPKALSVEPLDPARTPSVIMRKTEKDPRSPAQGGSEPITRNIADAL